MDVPRTPAPDSIRLDDYFRPILGRVWIIVAILAVVTTATYGYYERQARVYSASTDVFVGNSADPLQFSVTPGTDRNIENQARLFTTSEVLTAVTRVVGYKGTPRSLVNYVAVTPSRGSDVITITTRFGDARGAERLANAFAEAFISVGSAQQQEQIAHSIKGLRSQLRAIPVRPNTETERSTIGARVRQLQTAQQTAEGTARQLDRATAPSAAVSPKPVRNAIFACALALLASLGLVFGLERVDRRIKRVEDAAEFYDLSVLAVVPHSDGIVHVANGLPAVSPIVKEAFHQLRANLQLSAPDRPPRKILVTSALPGEGKSTVVRNLAIVLREWGQRVAVVDADLRNPTLGKLFDVQTEHGLTDVLTGDCTLIEAMTAVPVEALGLETLEKIHARSSGAGRSLGGNDLQQAGAVSPNSITLVGPGPRPANPPAVLSAAATQEAFDELLLTHDIVLIDSPPLLAVSDTVSLLSEVDAVVLVTRLSVTTQDSARRTTEVIARAPHATVAGVVVNDLSAFVNGGYGYGYGYGYGGDYGSKH